ncbi:MAG TPA: yteA family sporulation protein, partial [Pseudogracilibacillus sp.]|nr:yteA family sporulation protein [Pseudogracilibacillus sp.]
MEPLTKEQLTACKRHLSARQSKLIHQLKNRFDLEMSQTESIGELSSYDNHPADLGTELFERGKDLALQDHAERELEEINKALHALAEGTYGICRVCSMNIPYERLVTKPTADTCVEHAPEQGIDENERPIEEEVLDSHINPEEEPDEETNFYDKEDSWQDVSRYGTSDTPSDLYGDQESYDEMYANS